MDSAASRKWRGGGDSGGGTSACARPVCSLAASAAAVSLPCSADAAAVAAASAASALIPLGVPRFEGGRRACSRGRRWGMTRRVTLPNTSAPSGTTWRNGATLSGSLGTMVAGGTAGAAMAWHPECSPELDAFPTAGSRLRPRVGRVTSESGRTRAGFQLAGRGCSCSTARSLATRSRRASLAASAAPGGI